MIERMLLSIPVNGGAVRAARAAADVTKGGGLTSQDEWAILFALAIGGGVILLLFLGQLLIEWIEVRLGER